MTGIQASGVGSGLDINSLVSQLVAAERAPLDARITRKQSSATLEISALAQLKSGLAGLRDSMSGLQTTNAFASRSATSSDSAIFTATAKSEVQPGSYGIEVVNLAAAHKLASDPFVAGRDAVVGTGTLTVSYGTTSFTVVVDTESDTLTQIRDAINKATGNSGVSASILNETGGSRLILTSRATGEANAIKVTQSGGDGGLAKLVYDPAVPASNTLTETTAATDATVLVNGYEYKSATDSVTGAVDGLTINLKKADEGTEYTLTIANDTSSVSTRIKKFVADYNALAKIFASQQSYDATTGAAGPMLGDAFVRGLESQLRRDLSAPVAGLTGTYTSLAAIGITTDTKGQLTVNDTKLNAALSADFDGVTTLFAGDDGVAARMYDRLDAALQTTAPLALRNETLNKQIKTLATDKSNVDVRMTAVEKRYRAQFTALDTLLTQMQQTSNYLTQQLAASSSSG